MTSLQKCYDSSIFQPSVSRQRNVPACTGCSSSALLIIGLLAHHQDSQPEDDSGQEGWDSVSPSVAFQAAVASRLLGAMLSDGQVKGGR